MTPSKASTVFRELLQTADADLAMFCRRAGLQASAAAEDLLKTRELLDAIGAALESGTARDWGVVRAAWAGLRTKQDPFGAAASGSAEPQKPPLMQRFVVSKPSLGDVAPGLPGQAEQAKAKFVPVAKPKFVPGPGGPQPVPPAPPPAPQAPSAPAMQTPASPWLGMGSETAPIAHGAAPGQAMVPSGTPYGAAQQEDEWQPPLPPPPPMLAPLGPGPDPSGIAGPFTRVPPVAAAHAVPVAAAPPMPITAPAAMPSAAPSPGAALDESAGSVVHSVAKYAAFCASCAEFPDRLPQTMAGYGVPNDAARAALDQQWQDRFDDDEALLAKWEELFQSFRTSLRALG